MMSNQTSRLIYTSPGFQYSVNVRYDLENEAKVANYIPITQNVSVITDVINSFNEGASSRARLIIGNYGTGKSHLATILLAILAKVHPPTTYAPLVEKIEHFDIKSADLIRHELQRERVLPVLLIDSGQSFEQILLNGLRSALSQAGLKDLMPSTVFGTAIAQIDTWKNKYHGAIDSLELYLKTQAVTLPELREGLQNYDKKYYDLFCKGYSFVNHGAVFDPMLQTNAVDVFREVARLLPKAHKPFRGIVVVFDEFGKYLENAWEEQKSVNLKPLQDFAEACNSSEDNPISLILITHKPIAQYASKYGQDLVNEWKKVEGRFKSIELTSHSAKVYEIISNVILKENSFWTSFKTIYQQQFSQLKKQLLNTRLFSDLTPEELQRYVLEGSYPLHPVTSYALPRFSQKVAQNERTVFTFLCAEEFHTLGEFLHKNDPKVWNLLTIDCLYDYFEAQLQSANAEESINRIYVQTRAALNTLEEKETNESRIIKALAVIKVIGLNNVLPPTLETLKLCFYASDLDESEMANAFNNLRRRRILFEGEATGFIEIVQPGELDIEQEVSALMVKRRAILDKVELLNENLPQKYVLAKRYNDEYDMTRYFSCSFIFAQELMGENITLKCGEDGRIYYVLVNTEEELISLQEHLKSKDYERQIFILPTKATEKDNEQLEELLQKLDALKALYDDLANKDHTEADRIEIVLYIKDMEQQIKKILKNKFAFVNVEVIYQGEPQLQIRSNADLSRFVSKLCKKYFAKTPKFNNEMINKHHLTKPILKARQKVVDGLLKSRLEPNLGIVGLGPELSIYKSLILVKGLLIEDDESIHLIQKIKQLEDQGLREVLGFLRDLIFNSYEGVSFEELLEKLSAPPYGLRRGVIPILLGVVLHGQHREVILMNSQRQEIPITGATLDEAFSAPREYKLMKINWSEENILFCQRIMEIFRDNLDRDEELLNPVKKNVDAIKRWFLSIPRFSRDTKGLSKEGKNFRKLLKSEEFTSIDFLFTQIPKALGYDNLNKSNLNSIADRLQVVKEEMDCYLHTTLLTLERQLLNLVPVEGSGSLQVALKKWYTSLPEVKREYLYSDLTQEILNFVSSFRGENADDFLYRFCILLTGMRPEDWNDQTIKALPDVFRDIIDEVSSSVVPEIQGSIEDAENVVIIFSKPGGETVKRVLAIGEVSDTGQLLQNVLWSYIQDFGDAITNNEKRQIVINILEKLVNKNR